MALLLEEGYNQAMGARELRRAVMRLVDDPLSDFLLSGGAAAEGDVVVLDRAPGGGVVALAKDAGVAATAAAAAEADVVAYSSALP